MAPLQIICPGMGRTGTDSLRAALEILGYKTMHHKNFFNDPTLDPDVFLKAHFNRENADWDKVYEKYDAAIDLPTWLWYKDLMKKYPDAKIILTMRDVNSWHKSLVKIITDFREMEKTIVPKESLSKIMKFTDTVLYDYPLTNPDTVFDAEFTKKAYLNHYEDVIAYVPKEKLLKLELGEGWDRLCAFLGKDVPDIPYPHINSQSEFTNFVESIKTDDLLVGKKMKLKFVFT